MKISYNWLKNISLIFLLILLPLKSVYADGCDHGYEKLATISAILMIVVVSIIFTFIFVKNNELLVKVITFCLIFAFFISLIVFNIIYFIAPILFLYFFARKKGLITKIILYCVTFVFSFFVYIYIFPFGMNPIYTVIVLGILTIIIYINLPKKEKIVLKKIMSLFVILFFMFILFSNGNKISNFYISATCEHSGGELRGYCDTLYCKMPKK